MEKTNLCSATGCGQHAIAVVDLQQLCLAHLFTTCYERLEAINQNSKNWLFDETGLESERRFINECAQQATRIAWEEPALTNLERARLLDILLWANDLRKRFRRSPRNTISIPIRLISKMPRRWWHEETQTLDVSRHGAQTKCLHAVKDGDVLKVLRLDTGELAEARVVWRREKPFGAKEIGLEITDHENFWGLDTEPAH